MSFSLTDTKDESNECCPIPPIMTLPREVRAVIYRKLSQSQLLQLRLVCVQWSVEIDDLCDFSVDIDDRKPYLERILQLRVNKCTVTHFENLPSSGLSTTYFKHPNLLRSLHFLTDSVSSDNFFCLLGDSAQYLREFSTLLSLPLISTIFPITLSNVCFDKLISLHICLSTMPAGGTVPFRPPAPIKTEDVLFSQLLGNPMKNLKNLKIEIRCLGISQISRFSALVFSFIGKHWKTLEKLDFDLIQGHGMPQQVARPLLESDLNTIDFSLLNKVGNLKFVRVINSTSTGIDISVALLALQKNLEYFETDILPIPNGLFKEVALKNYESLVQVDISDMSVWTEEDAEPFDCSVFQNCVHLRKLILDRNAVERRLYECAELINLFELPDSLLELALNYFLVLSDELLLLFGGSVGESLESVSLTQCGSSDVYGVDGSVLEKIIGMPCANFIEISTMNYSDVGERLKLNVILNAFGYGNDRSYFQLSRVATSLAADLIVP